MALSFTAANSERIDLAGLPSLAAVSGWTIMGWVQLRAGTSTQVVWDISQGSSNGTRADIQSVPQNSTEHQ